MFKQEQETVMTIVELAKYLKIPGLPPDLHQRPSDIASAHSGNSHRAAH